MFQWLIDLFWRTIHQINAPYLAEFLLNAFFSLCAMGLCEISSSLPIDKSAGYRLSRTDMIGPLPYMIPAASYPVRPPFPLPQRSVGGMHLFRPVVSFPFPFYWLHQEAFAIPHAWGARIFSPLSPIST